MPLDVQEAIRKGELLKVLSVDYEEAVSTLAQHGNGPSSENRLDKLRQVPLIGSYLRTTAGVRFSFRCDTSAFSVLGPGVPLYFRFVKWIIFMLVVCMIPYAYLAVRYACTEIDILDLWCLHEHKDQHNATNVTFDEVLNDSALPYMNVCNKNVHTSSWWLLTAAARGPWNCTDKGEYFCDWSRPIRCSDVLFSENGIGFSRAATDHEVICVSLVSVLLFFVSVPILRRRSKIATKKTLKVVSERQYTVLLTGLPFVKISELDELAIMKFLKDSLDATYPTNDKINHHIVHVCFVFKLGKVSKLLKEERAVFRRRKRVSVIIADLKQMQNRAGGGSCFSNWLLKLRIRYANYQLRKATARRAAVLERLRKMEKLDVIGAFVTFEHTIAAYRAVELFTPVLGRRFIYAFSFCPGAFFARVSSRVSHQIYENSWVSVKWPLDASDITWENLGKSTVVRAFWRLLAGILLVLPISAAAAATYVLLVIKNKGVERDDFAKQVLAKFADSYLLPQHWHQRTVFGNKLSDLLTFLAGPGMAIPENVIRESIFATESFQQRVSKEEAAKSIMWKMTAASIINVSILGFMVHVAIDPDMGDSQEKNWYVKGGLAHDVILIGMTNVFVTPFIGLLSPWNIPFYLKRLMVSPLHSRMSQEDLVDLYGGSEFRLAYRYSAVFKTLFFTLLYAPLAPAVLLPFGVCTLMGSIVLTSSTSFDYHGGHPGRVTTCTERLVKCCHYFSWLFLCAPPFS
jgi:hypothetical protein